MPIIEKSTYKAPFLLKYSHVQTIYPSRFRQVSGISYQRFRIDTPDDDFIDLDLSSVAGKKAVIVAHGLGGHSNRTYIKGMIKAFNNRGWDGLAMNFRGCSGEPNRKLRFYHSGSTDDLHTVIKYVNQHFDYQKLVLVGFSLGGNMMTKYLGEQGKSISSSIRAAVVYSVPCDLSASVNRLDKWHNGLYRERFLRMLHRTIRAKREMIPDPSLNDEGFESITSLRQYDDRYTAPIHGFKDASDYYKQCSCKQFINSIAVPTLMVEAKNDPLLTKSCFPMEEARRNKNFFLEMPSSGGHVGFIAHNKENEYWSESRAVSFVSNPGYL